MDDSQAINDYSAGSGEISFPELIFAVLIAAIADICGFIPLLGALIAAALGGFIWLWLYAKGQRFKKKYNPALAIGGSMIAKFIPFIGPLLGLYTVVVVRAYYKSKTS